MTEEQRMQGPSEDIVVVRNLTKGFKMGDDWKLAVNNVSWLECF